MSPLPMTGMLSAATTAAISSQPCAAREHLRPGARMQRDGLAPGILTAKGDGHRIAEIFVPAASDFRGDRKVSGPTNRPDDALHQIQVLQTTGTAVPPNDLLHRTAEVDIDEIRGVMLA